MFSYYKLRANKDHNNIKPECIYNLEKSQYHMISHSIYLVISLELNKNKD